MPISYSARPPRAKRYSVRSRSTWTSCGRRPAPSVSRAPGGVGDPGVLSITSRDPGAPTIEYIGVSGGIFKDMLIHDFDVFRWMLEDEALTLFATGSCLTDQAIAGVGDIDSTAV